MAAICNLCCYEIGKDHPDATSQYRMMRERVDPLDLPDTLCICQECCEKETIRLKRQNIYGPAIKALSDHANDMSFSSNVTTDAEALLDAFVREHRTLQGDMFLLLEKFIELLAGLDENMFFDDRNRWVRVHAQKIREALK